METYILHFTSPSCSEVNLLKSYTIPKAKWTKPKNLRWDQGWHFLKLGFSPYKAEQPLQSMELQEKEV